MNAASKTLRYVTENCPSGKEFFFIDGHVAHHLAEFHSQIADVADHVLDYHRHHFGHWLRDVIGDRELGTRVDDHGRSNANATVLRTMIMDLVAERLPRTPRKSMSGKVAVSVGRDQDAEPKAAKQGSGGKSGSSASKRKGKPGTAS